MVRPRNRGCLPIGFVKSNIPLTRNFATRTMTGRGSPIGPTGAGRVNTIEGIGDLDAGVCRNVLQSRQGRVRCIASDFSSRYSNGANADIFRHSDRRMLIKLRFRFPDIFLGMMLAVAIFAMGATFWSSENISRITEGKAEPKANDPASNHMNGDIGGRSRTADFIFGLIVVGLFQAGILYVQLRFLRKSLRATVTIDPLLQLFQK